MSNPAPIQEVVILGLVLLGEIIPASALAGLPVKVAGGSAASIQFSLDGNRLFYVNNDADSLPALYSVPSGGGEAAKLNVPLAGGLFLNSFWQTSPFYVSPDGSHVYYAGGELGRAGIFAAPSDGGPSLDLSGPLAPGSPFLSTWRLSPDGSRIVYVTSTSSNNTTLYSVATAGGTPNVLDTLSNATINNFYVSPNNNQVIYRSGRSTNRIVSVPIDGGAPTTLVGNRLEPFGGGDFLLSPDGTQILYKYRPSSSVPSDFYTVPTAGGPPVMVNGPLTPGKLPGGLARESSAKFSGDGSHVVYAADQDTLGQTDIYSVPSAGGTPVKLNGQLHSYYGYDRYEVSPDGAHVLFLGTQDGADHGDLYLVPIAGGEPVRVNGPSDRLYGDYANFFSPDSSHVVYLTANVGDKPREVFSVPVSGGEPVNLNGPLVPGGNAGYYGPQNFSPDGGRFVLAAAKETVDSYELYIVPTTGGKPTKLSGDLRPAGSAVTFSADGSRLFFKATPPGQSTNFYSRVVREHWSVGSGDWDSAGNWDKGEIPDDVMRTAITGPASVVASGNATTRTVDELQLGIGEGVSTLTLELDAMLTATNGVVIGSNGVLGGNGVIVGHVRNAGILSPGLSRGTLRIDGDYSQDDNGALRIELANLSSFDTLLVSGKANLAGVLELSLFDFSPHVGEAFDILTATDGLNGRFTDVKLRDLPAGTQFDVHYTTNSLRVLVRAVPEPTALAMCAIVLALLAWQFRGTLS